MNRLDLAQAIRFANVALGHVTREFPNKLDHVLASPDDLRSPRALHPMFYGSFDWHSCVHSYWLLSTIHRTFELPVELADRIRAVVNAHFTDENVRIEVEYLARPLARTFERPYGWAWLLKLAAELASYTTEEGQRWHRTLAPLASAFAARFMEHLPQLTYPIRTGSHANSAFAIALALEWAEATGHDVLRAMLLDKARAFFENDGDCEAWEPGGDDFLSPALVEADCMRRVLDDRMFQPWLDRFLPHLRIDVPSTLFTPATVSNRSDGKIAHLDGLNLSRAWCFRGLASALPEADVRHASLLDAASRHLEASLPHVTGDYMGEHWLATYAVLALTA